MAYNKVIYGGDTLVDLTNDTVESSKMLSGTIAHDASGNEIYGEIETYLNGELAIIFGDGVDVSDRYGGIPLKVYFASNGGVLENKYINSGFDIWSLGMTVSDFMNLANEYGELSVADGTISLTVMPEYANQIFSSLMLLPKSNVIPLTAVPDDLKSENILSGKNIFGVNGSLVTQTIRTGNSVPDDLIGVNGDLYFVVEN